MKKLAASGIFLLFLVIGGLWVGLVRLIPEGLPRSIFIIAFGVGFAGIFVWLLISRIPAILKGEGSMLRHAGVAALNLALLLLAFAAVYEYVGIIDNTQPDSPIVHSLTKSLYYSVVTFTTVGYGDFYPVGPGRVLAGIEALTGYLILGILASTAASVVAPDEEGKRRKREKEERER